MCRVFGHRGLRTESWMFIEVRVKPGSAVSQLDQQPDGRWLARIKSRPVEGRANAELIALVAKQFGCPRSAVSIKSGASGRLKLVKIDSE